MQDIEQIRRIVSSIQKAMQKRGFSAQTQWEELAITRTNVVPKSFFLQRLSLYGVNLSNNEVKSLWNYFDIQPHSVRYEDFVKMMSATFPSIFRDESSNMHTLNDYQQSRPYTTGTPRRNYQTSSTRERSFGGQRQTQTNLNPQSNQQDLIRRTSNYDPDYDDNHYYDSRRHDYYTCQDIKERELRTMPLSDIKTIEDLSDSSIQRQTFDGPDSETLRKSFRSKNPLKKTLAIISDCAYSSDPSSWSCFLKWRDPTKDTIDAQDLINAIKKDHKITLNLGDVQKVIEKYGPLNQMTFKLMLTEGHRYSLYKDFDDDFDDY